MVADIMLIPLSAMSSHIMLFVMPGNDIWARLGAFVKKLQSIFILTSLNFGGGIHPFPQSFNDATCRHVRHLRYQPDGISQGNQNSSFVSGDRRDRWKLNPETNIMQKYTCYGIIYWMSESFKPSKSFFPNIAPISLKE